MVLKRMLFIALIAIVINAILISPIYAIGDVISSGKDFLSKGNKVGDVISGNALQTTSDFIYNMFLVVAIVLAVGVGTVLGIKFITSSVEGQAKIKEALVPYIVGCIVIFAAFPIWSFVVEAGQDATGTREIDVNEKTEMSASQVGDLNWEYIEGKVSLSQLSDYELELLFDRNQIYRNLGHYINTEGKTKEEAINMLTDYQRELYLECERRGLREWGGSYE